MRKWIDLFESNDVLSEMPLASLSLHGNWSDDTPDGDIDLDSNTDNRPKNSFVNRVDRRLIRNERLQERIGKLLSGFSLPINLYVWNSNSAFYFYDNLDYGQIDAAATRRLPNDLRKIVSTPTQGINVILSHNEGGSKKHPLTPWMTVHRIAHALDGIGGGFSVEKFKEIKDTVSRYYGTPEQRSQISYSKHDIAVEFLNSVCTFKAARDKNVLLDAPSYGEGFTEMFVQYMVYGRIPYNPVPRSLIVDGDELQCTDWGYITALFNRIAKEIVAHYAGIVKQAKGKSFIC